MTDVRPSIRTDVASAREALVRAYDELHDQMMEARDDMDTEAGIGEVDDLLCALGELTTVKASVEWLLTRLEADEI